MALGRLARRVAAALSVGLFATIAAAYTLCPPIVVAAPPEQAQPADTATPASPVPGASPSAVVSPTPTPVPVPPTATPRPVLGLVLVPYGVRPAIEPWTGTPTAGVLRGRVVDASRRGLYGQVVKVTGQGFSRSAATDGNGSYDTGEMPPGSYTVVVDRQICTPAEGVQVQAGRVTQADFVEIKVPTATRTATGTVSPTATATATSTPRPQPTATGALTRPSPTPTPKAAHGFSLGDIFQWWSWLGFEIDFSSLVSSLYLGVMGGAAFLALGIIVRLVRK